MQIEYDLKLREAISDAERLAEKYPGQTYKVVRFVRNNSCSYSSLLENDPLPDHCEQVTTVTRHPLSHESDYDSLESLENVTMQVIKNLPAGVSLLDTVVVEYFPHKPTPYVTYPEIFSYQFMSTEGRNVATWMPCLDGVKKGALMQPGFDGRGRIWKNGLIDIENESTRRLPVLQKLMNDSSEDSHHTSAFRESHHG